MAEATFAFDLHVLSTPPAFNLSQNQTLQFKSVQRFLLGRNQNLKVLFPLALHLSMNPAPFRSAREAFLRFPSRLVNFFFFDFPKISFRHRRTLFAAAKFLFKKNSRRLSRLFFSFVTLSRHSLSVSTGEGGHFAGAPRSSSFLWKVFYFF